MSVAFMAGICAVMQEIDIIVITTFALLFAIAALFFLRRKKLLCLGIVIFFFLGMGRMYLGQKHRYFVAARFSGRSTECEMTVTQFSDDGKVIVVFYENGEEYKAYLRTEEDIQLYPGDIVRGKVTFRDPFYSKVNLTDFSVYLCSRDVYVYADAEEIVLTGRHAEGLDGAVYAARRYMDKVGEANFKDDSRALFNAMIFGDERLISPKLDEGLRASGLSHIAVVSGMHISVIIAIISFFLQKLLGKNRFAYVFAVLGAVFVSAVTGAGASVIRALVMCGVYQLSRITYRENDIYTTVASSALIMLAVNPYFLFNAGFILSVLSVVGIILYSSKFVKMCRWFLSKSAAEAAGVSIAAQFAVTPVLVMYFGTFTPYALISNLFVAALSTMYVLTGMVFFFLCRIPLISEVIKALLQLMADSTEGICYAVASVPGAVVETGEISKFFILGWIFIMFVFAERHIRLQKVNIACAVLIISLALGSFWEKSIKMRGFFPIYAGKVMSFLKAENGSSVMIDCPDFFDALEYENSCNTDICCVVLSSDYIGQLRQFSEKSPPGVIIASDELLGSYHKRQIREIADRKNIRAVFLKRGQSVRVEGVILEYIQVGNTGVTVLEMRYENCRTAFLQGCSREKMNLIRQSGEKINCDYLKLPYNWENTDFSCITNGKIIENQKKVMLR